VTRPAYGQIIEHLAAGPAGDDSASDPAALPKETLYLPFVAGSFRLAMGLVPLGAPMLELDELYPAQMVLRRELLDRSRETVFAALPGSELARGEVLDRVATLLASRYPAWFRRDGESLHNRLTDETWDFAAPRRDPLETAGRLVQEDLCILQQGADGPFLTAAVVCFPSRWTLADKIGRGMAEIHAPVPGFGATLAAPVERLITRLPADRLVARLNWSLIDDPELHQPADSNYRTDRNIDVTQENAGERLFLRVERQTLSRLPASGAVLFTIRVHVYPLGAAIVSRATAGRLAAAVRALPDEMHHYKGFLPFRDALLGWLDAAA
jgi:dimethylamine monooxygenase subunit A